MNTLQKPDKSFFQLWNISFGFFGVQIAYALQSANISRIFSTLGADPHDLSYFWILPPLMGMVVQPLVGIFSDRTWTRFGRRIPYLFLGALLAVFVMCMLPNAGSFGLSVSGAMVFGLFFLMLLDTSINVAMQPFKMMVGDIVNERQKSLAYSIQSFLCNAGSLVGFCFPFILAGLGISRTAEQGVVPDSVIYSFYGGALILILCVIYTSVKVKEYPPELHAAYNASPDDEPQAESQPSGGILHLLAHAPKVFWTVGLVQFFCWSAFMLSWTYGVGTVAEGIFHAPTVVRDGLLVLDTTSEAYQTAGDWNGICIAVQAIGAMLWAVAIPRFKNKRVVYSLSLLIGALGFVGFGLMRFSGLDVETARYVAFLPFFLQGAAWAAMLALPFTILTNALHGPHMGTYLGLFNCTICFPQIVTAACAGTILKSLTAEGCLAPEYLMIVLAGLCFVIASLCVFAVKER